QPDREAADFFGIPHGELAAQIRTAISNDVLGTFATGAATDDIDIRIGTEWPSRPGEARGPRTLEEIALVRAYTPQGESVSLLQLVEPLQGEGAVAIAHYNGDRALTVLANNQGRTVAEIMEELTPELERLQDSWPAGYTFRIGGESEDAGEAFGSAGIALVVDHPGVRSAGHRVRQLPAVTDHYHDHAAGA